MKSVLNIPNVTEMNRLSSSVIVPMEDPDMFAAGGLYKARAGEVNE